MWHLLYFQHCIPAAFSPFAVAALGKWSMGIKIVREKKVKDYTFTDEMLNLPQPAKSEAVAKKEKAEPDFRLRDSAKVNKLKKSKITGGHSMQGHSPVYE
jgi:hypothetical protein